MLVQQENPATPLTPLSSPPADVQHPEELSPRSTNSSFASTDTHESSPNSLPKESANTENDQEHGALKRLEYALERNSLFSRLAAQKKEMSENNVDTTARRQLVKPCVSSLSSCNSDSPDSKHDNDCGHIPRRIPTPLSSPEPDNGVHPANIIFQCPLCLISCNSRHEFNEHLVIHSGHFACPKCTFLTAKQGTLREHIAEAHDSDFEEMLMTDEEMRTPKTNSQGKVKTFKCKQCGHRAVTKMEFWDHAKTHIRTEKMLTCPKCPFVTEYKHHLEYHLRNHTGSKPFNCNKCPYSCVNKSMLNSHLKSHSNIYQYRCADCSYATKYCHSLKLHLRKYNHKPAMVLNPDGTPNPLPIIDVYGTRRGPKIKRSFDPTLTDGSQELVSPPPMVRERKPRSNRNASISTQESPQRSNASTASPTSQNYHRAITPEMLPQPSVRDDRRFERNNEANLEFIRNSNNNIMLQHVQMDQRTNSSMPVPAMMGSLNPTAIQGLLMSNSARSPGVNSVTALALQSLLLQNSANQAAIDMVKNPANLYAAAAFGQYILGNPSLHNATQVEATQSADEQRAIMFAQYMNSQQHLRSPRASASPVLSPSSNNGGGEDMETTTHTPLDLRRFNKDHSRNKRKGKALRYAYRSPPETSTSNDSEQILDFSNNNTNGQENSQKPVMPKQWGKEGSIPCKYCDISFPKVLYHLHMQFHSHEDDPFRCQQCGVSTKDQVGFFMHLATASH